MRHALLFTALVAGLLQVAAPDVRAQSLASAAPESVGLSGERLAQIAKVFGDWKDEPTRDAEGADGAEKGLVSGNRIATIQVSWEPGPGVVCSDKQPLSACKILPQQKLWTVIVDIVVKTGK